MCKANHSLHGNSNLVDAGCNPGDGWVKLNNNSCLYFATEDFLNQSEAFKACKSLNVVSMNNGNRYILTFKLVNQFSLPQVLIVNINLILKLQKVAKSSKNKIVKTRKDLIYAKGIGNETN